MHRLQQILQPNIVFVLLLVVMMVAVGGAVYVANQLAADRDGMQVVHTPIAVTSIVYSTPSAPLPPLDPAIIPYLNYGQPEYGVVPLSAYNPNVPPVGAYLPRTGNSQFELPPTPMPTVVSPPTPVPYPTSPPLPTAILTPTLDLVATVKAFDASLPVPSFYTSCPPSGLPVDGLLTQQFHAYHSGIDLGIPLGTPVFATQSAIVTWADWNVYGYGNLVILQSDRYITYYAHLTSVNVLVGEYVQKGAIIGFSGSTGNSSGPHVHYETRIDDVPVDPLTFEARGLGTC